MTVLKILAAIALILAMPGTCTGLLAYWRWKVEGRPSLRRFLTLWAWYAMMLVRNLLIATAPMLVYLLILKPHGVVISEPTLQLSCKLTLWYMMYRLGRTVGAEADKPGASVRWAPQPPMPPLRRRMLARHVSPRVSARAVFKIIRARRASAETVVGATICQ